jgi:hypothetical protein
MFNKHHAVHYGVAAVLLAGFAALAAEVYQLRHRTPVVIHAGAPSRHTGTVAWGELAQTEVDLITAALNAGAAPKKPVLIVCADHNCEDMALDFENAFESAHWPTTSDKPLLDMLTGVHVACPDADAAQKLAAAIETAVNHRFAVATIAPNFKDDKYAVIISKKPRGS